MGHNNLDRALAVQAKAGPPRAAIVLLIMARWAHDDDEPPRYWRGGTFLAEIMGCDYRTIKRAWSDLVDAGLITDDGYAGRRRVWRLNLPLSPPVDKPMHSPDE